jgi:hypothetical protein
MKALLSLLSMVLVFQGPAFSEVQDPAVNAFEEKTVQVDGQRIGHQEVTRSSPPRFFDVEYPIDENIVKGKAKVTIRFEAAEGNSIASVFGIRMIRADSER